MAHVKELDSVKKRKVKRNVFVNFVLFLTVVSSFSYFGVTLWTGQKQTIFLQLLISSLLLMIFSLLFVVICITNPTRKKGSILLGSFFLILFQVFGIMTSLGVITIPALEQLEDFTGRSLTEVVSWASKNNVTLEQDYEYSDMVEEYQIISQNIKAGEKIKDISSLEVAVSNGPNPDKEIIVSDMMGWDSEEVIDYVLDNHLNNVEVSFTESEYPEDTVTSQSKSGTMKRSDALKLTFSLGNHPNDSDVKMVDLTNKSEFEAIFYLKQHRISYEVKSDFSSKINRGYISRQSVEAGSMVPINNDEKVVITVSKGAKINVPNLKKMDMVEITQWVIENKLKLSFTNRYDEKVKQGNIIEANYSKGDSIEQDTMIEVVISKGQLVMKDFKTFEEFKAWANKNGVSYEEVHEFSDDVEQGEVISYSYKKGDVIKNNDVITVTISDGKECSVPDVVGMSKSEVIEALEKVNLNYNFVTQNSDKEKNTAIKQSISAGSKVSFGTTVTVTLSNGKRVESREESSSSSSSSSGSSSNSSSGSSSSGGNSGNTSTPTPTCDRSQTTMVYIYPDLISNVPSTTCSNIKNAYPNVRFSCQYVSSGPGIGLLVNSSEIDEHALNHCDTYTLKIQQN